jgi:hypothetical protein
MWRKALRRIKLFARVAFAVLEFAAALGLLA